MAAGDTLCVFTALNNEPPASVFATLDTRNSRACLDFDAGTDESAVFKGVMPRHYDGGGVTVRLIWRATSAVADDVIWNTAFERANTDIDADSFATANAATGTANGTSGISTTTSINHADGAEMDSVAVGEEFYLKVTRDANNASDTMTGDAELYAVEIIEQ